MKLEGKRVLRLPSKEPLREDGAGTMEFRAVEDRLGDAVNVAPPSSLRERLMGTVSKTHRFPDFEERVATLVELPLEKIREFMLGIDTKEPWLPGPIPGMDFFHFEGGASVKNAITGFTRIAPGITFPEHEHVGEECVLVMQGSFRDADGEEHGVGDEVWLPADSSHTFEVTSKIPLLYLAIVQGGLRVGGVLIPPGDPRA